MLLSWSNPCFCRAPHIKSVLEHNTITYNTTQKRSEQFVLKHNNLLWTLPQNTTYCSFSLSTPLRLEMSPFFPKVLKWAPFLLPNKTTMSPFSPCNTNIEPWISLLLRTVRHWTMPLSWAPTYRLPSMTKSPINYKKGNEPLFPCTLQM